MPNNDGQRSATRFPFESANRRRNRRPQRTTTNAGEGKYTRMANNVFNLGPRYSDEGYSVAFGHMYFF